jgi:hypothetical protein
MFDSKSTVFGMQILRVRDVPGLLFDPSGHIRHVTCTFTEKFVIDVTSDYLEAIRGQVRDCSQRMS